jgi:predicted transglutaminase-like cysteine proteinase
MRHLAVSIVTAYVLALMPVMAGAMQNPFLTTQQTRHGDLGAFSKWTRLMPRYNAEKASALKKCTDESCPVKRWEALLQDLKKKPVREQLEGVNDFFNALPYAEDNENYGMEDYWATPYEFLQKNAGDCEDYAIAKYISLKRLGVSEASMRIIILQDNNLGGIMHAVLEVRVDSTRYLLDNQSSSVTEEGSVYHYRPIYALNNSAWWNYQ